MVLQNAQQLGLSLPIEQVEGSFITNGNWKLNLAFLGKFVVLFLPSLFSILIIIS